MTHKVSFLLGTMFAVLLHGSVLNAQLVEVDSVILDSYNFGEWPDSTLTYTDNFPTSVVMDERDYGLSTPFSSFAERHDILFSNDAGANPLVIDGLMPFDISFDLTLDSQFDTPRREVGFRINNGVTGDALFIVNTDAHEIAAFGGPFPFYNFNDDGIQFNNGDTLNMRIIYLPPDVGVATFEYVIDIGNGPVSSGIMDASNLEGRILPNSTIGLYMQSTPQDTGTNGFGQRIADTSEFITATFGNFDFDGPDATNPADFNGDGSVDGVDFLAWQNGFGIMGGATKAQGDFNNDGNVDGVDFLGWQNNFGSGAGSAAVPEPSTLACFMVAVTAYWASRRRRSIQN